MSSRLEFEPGYNSTHNSLSNDYNSDSDDETRVDGDGKRRRVLHACDSCRRKKIRCDGVHPICKNCAGSKTQCIYSEMQPRKPRSVKKRKASSIREVESRLERIETMLETLAGKVIDKEGYKDKASSVESPSYSDDDRDDDGSAVPDDTKVGSDLTQNGPVAIDPAEPSSAQLLPIHPSVIGVNSLIASRPPPEHGSSRYFLSKSRRVEMFFSVGSSLTMFSRSGLEWVAGRTGDSTFMMRMLRVLQGVHDTIQDRQKMYFMTDSSESTEGSELIRELAKHTALLDTCLNVFRMVPGFWHGVVSMDEIRALLDKVKAEVDTGRFMLDYSELVVVFGFMAMMVTFLAPLEEMGRATGLSPDELWHLHMRYSYLALVMLHKAMVLGPNLVVLQGACVLLFALHCGNNKPSSQVSPLALQCAFDMGLHRRESYTGLSPEECNRRKLILWTLYLQEKLSAMKMSKASIIQDWDISVDFHSPECGFGYKEYGIDLLATWCNLLKIDGLTYQELFSAAASTKTPHETVKSVHKLSKDLDDWAETLPERIRPRIGFKMSESYNSATFLSEKWYNMCLVVQIHMVYYQIRCALYRLPSYNPKMVRQGLKHEVTVLMSGDPSGEAILTRSDSCPTDEHSVKAYVRKRLGHVLDGWNISVEASREIIRGILDMRKCGQEAVGGSIHHSGNAFMLLFVKCLTRPHDSRNDEDLADMKQICDILASIDKLVTNQCGAEIQFDHLWKMLHDTARDYVAKMRDEANATAPSHILQYTRPEKFKNDMFLKDLGPSHARPVAAMSFDPSNERFGATAVGSIPSMSSASSADLTPEMTTGTSEAPVPDFFFDSFEPPNADVAQSLYSLPSFTFIPDTDLSSFYFG